MLAHSKLLRWLARPMLPKGWTPGGFKTSGGVETQRALLQTLSNRLAGIGVFSFLCQCVSASISHFAHDLYATSGNFEAIMFLATTLMVQVVPSALTLFFLGGFCFHRSGEGTLMQTLLTHNDVSVALFSDSAAAVRHNEQASLLPEDVAGLREEIARLRTQESKSRENQQKVLQLAADNARLREEIALLRAQVAKA